MKQKEECDPVQCPNHYTYGGIEVKDYIAAKGFGFRSGNIIKYISRYRHKNGVEDLRKAQEILGCLIYAIEHDELQDWDSDKIMVDNGK